MRIHSVTRARFKKSGAVAHTHTLHFSTREQAREYVRSSKRLDAMNKIKHDWKYSIVSGFIY